MSNKNSITVKLPLIGEFNADLCRVAQVASTLNRRDLARVVANAYGDDTRTVNFWKQFPGFVLAVVYCNIIPTRPFCVGEVVTIYQDPYTKHKPEGKAELVRCLRQEDEYGESRWLVRFCGAEDDGCFERTITRDR